MNFEILDSHTSDAETVTALEGNLGLTFPDEYRQFLQRFNGGFCRNVGIYLDRFWNQNRLRSICCAYNFVGYGQLEAF